jgi:quercetin dioxygenase-like cupin family protein
MNITGKHLIGLSILAFSAGFGFNEFIPEKAPGRQTSSLTRMDSCLNTLDPGKTTPIDAGWIYWLTAKALSGGLNLKMTRVDKRQAYHAAHKHADPEIIFILEGTARLTLEGEERIVPPNTALYCPPWLMHGISRASDEPLRYLIIRTE